MKLCINLFLIIYCIFYSNFAISRENNELPLPRFVTIKSSEANVRTGPNLKYPIKWIFKNKGEPVEIIAQWEHWRKIRDITNEDGWVHESMIKGSRTAIIIGNELQYSYYKPDLNSKKLMLIEPQVRLKLLNCKLEWCQIKINDKKSWIQRKHLWGIYDNEEFLSK